MKEGLESAQASAEERLRFETKVDWWLAAIGWIYVTIAVGIPAWHMAGVLFGGQPWSFALSVLPLLIFAGVWALAYPCYYEFLGKALIVRTGMIHVAIPLLAVTSVKRTRTPMSAPAWSLDRLEICYGTTQRVVISPKQRERFLKELQSRAPQLVRVGDELAVARDWLEAERRAKRASASRRQDR